jgi:hypothetical protein
MAHRSHPINQITAAGSGIDPVTFSGGAIGSTGERRSVDLVDVESHIQPRDHQHSGRALVELPCSIRSLHEELEARVSLPDEEHGL